MLAHPASVLAALLSLSAATFAQRDLPREEVSDAAPPVATPVATLNESIPEGFVAQGAIHRLFLPAGHELIARISASGRALSIEDYGSFVMLEVVLQGANELAVLT